MATMSEQPVLDLEVLRKATANWLATKGERERKTAAAAGQYTKADDKARLPRMPIGYSTECAPGRLQTRQRCRPWCGTRSLAVV